MLIKRGDIFKADLGNSEEAGSEQQGERPVVIIQNNIGNTYSPTVIVAAISASFNKKSKELPVHVEIALERDSVILLEQIRTLDKRKLKEKIGKLDYLKLKNVDDAFRISVGL